jgi:hypothetical protein
MPGAAGVGFTVTEKVCAALDPQALFAVTDTVNVPALANVMFTPVVPCPLLIVTPVFGDTDHVYETAFGTALIV